jgi:hypothetical protein
MAAARRRRAPARLSAAALLLLLALAAAVQPGEACVARGFRAGQDLETAFLWGGG